MRGIEQICGTVGCQLADVLGAKRRLICSGHRRSCAVGAVLTRSTIADLVYPRQVKGIFMSESKSKGWGPAKHLSFCGVWLIG